MVAVDNQEAFALCLRLNREESIIAGPSSAMALAGALELVPDEPGNVVVVIFPDNAFKYASSFVKHVPAVRSKAPAASASGGQGSLLKGMVEHVRNNPTLTIGLDDARGLIEGKQAFVVDVRSAESYAARHVAGAVNVPLEQLGERANELPQDLSATVITVCNRGNMSLSGVLYLTSLGYRNALSLNEGTIGWADRGFPVEAE